MPVLAGSSEQLPEIYALRPAVYLTPKSDPSQRVNREIFAPWMHSIAESKLLLPPHSRFSAQNQEATDVFVSTSFLHFWVPLSTSVYAKTPEASEWALLQLGQVWKAKARTPGPIYLGLVSSKGDLENYKKDTIPGYADRQAKSRQARDKLEQQVLENGDGPCFCQSVLREMDRRAAAAR